MTKMADSTTLENRMYDLGSAQADIDEIDCQLIENERLLDRIREKSESYGKEIQNLKSTVQKYLQELEEYKRQAKYLESLCL